MTGRNTPSFLLARVVRLLPSHRQDWGLAMQAELAGIESASARWQFARSCTRAVLARPTVMLKLGSWTSAAAVQATAAVLAGEIPFVSTRREALAMVAFLTALFWASRRPLMFGPLASNRAARLVLAGGFAIGAAKSLIFLNGLRLPPHGEDFTNSTTRMLVWTLTLAVYTIALARVTSLRAAIPARNLAIGVGAGVVMAAVWLIVVFLLPGLPSSSAPEIFAITASAATAVAVVLRSDRLGQGLLAGLLAAASSALVIGVLLDGPLPAWSRWVPNNAPPVWPPDAPDRLVDSIGVWLLGLLLAAALSLAVRSRQSIRSARMLPVNDQQTEPRPDALA